MSECENRLANLIYGQQWHLDRLYAEYSRELGTLFRNFKGKLTAAQKRELDRVMERFDKDAYNLLKEQQDKSIHLANICNDKMAREYLKNVDIRSEEVQKIVGGERAIAALEFARRAASEKFDLSNRVWNLSQQTKEQITEVLGTGVFNGRSAKDMAKDLQGYLKEPNRRYRRVRNAEGKLVLSNPAKEYHPGRGIYRSSYKNALRLSRTEVNMAYRRADHHRRQDMDFVMGNRISLSASHPRYDICDELVGLYPKGFIFTGWHPQCLCITTAVMLPEREFIKQLNGEAISEKYRVKKIPGRASRYIKQHSKDMNRGRNKPYFIQDNFTMKDGVFVPKQKVYKT